MVCVVCRKIDLADLYYIDGTPKDIVHHSSYRALEVSSYSCSLCKLFYQGLQLPTEQLDPLAKISKYFPIAIRSSETFDKAGESQGLYKLVVKWNNQYRNSSCGFSLYTDNSDPQSFMVPSRLVPGKTLKSPQEAVPLLNEWLANCGAHHDSCHQGPAALPTRILRIYQNTNDANISVQLETSNGRIGKYTVLSHPWTWKTSIIEDETILCTTKANLSDHMEQIPMENLPKTFQDAITITKNLGIHALWIDAPCIVQDDAQDCQRERLQAGEVYRHAYLSLAASGAQAPEDGLFLERNRTNHHPLKYTFYDHATRNVSEGRVYVRPVLHDVDDLFHNPFHRQGWTLQEHLLPRRIVYFDTDQMIWICQEDTCTEDRMPHNRRASKLYGVRELIPLDSPQRRNQGALEQWNIIVKDFSERTLSRSSDKLPALASIAKIIEERHQDTYIAGLWKNHLIPGLLWSHIEG